MSTTISQKINIVENKFWYRKYGFEGKTLMGKTLQMVCNIPPYQRIH